MRQSLCVSAARDVSLKGCGYGLIVGQFERGVSVSVPKCLLSSASAGLNIFAFGKETERRGCIKIFLTEDS